MCIYVEGMCCLSKCRRHFQVNSAVRDYIQQHVFIFIFSLASRSIRVHRHQGIRVAVVTSLVHPTKSSSVTFPYILNYRYFFYFFFLIIQILIVLQKLYVKDGPNRHDVSLSCFKASA